jgi:hypothetical protein
METFMNLFYLKLILSFFVGGIWITLVTLAAERFGSKIGGFIGGLPSTVVVSFFFIAWTQGSSKAFHASTVFPAAMAMNAIFVIVYVLLVRKRLLLGISGGIVVWLMGQSLLVISNVHRFIVSILLWALILITSYYILEKKLKIYPSEKIKVAIKPIQLVGRAVFSGGMIAVAVIMSKVGGAIWGGIFSSFPAVFISTLIITALSVSPDFSRSLASPLMISGLINCVVFSVVFRFLILQMNILSATFLSYAASIVSGGFTYLFIRNQTGIKSRNKES